MTTEDGRRSADLPAEPSAAADRHPAERPPAPTARSTRCAPAGPSRSASRSCASCPASSITALVISVLIKTFLVQAFYIPSGSMENTLLVNDRVLVNKLADKPDEIHRGDVDRVPRPRRLAERPRRLRRRRRCVGLIRDGLVFVGLAPAAGEEDLIKRVIGVGGDKVVVLRRRAATSPSTASPLDEPYLYPGDEPSGETVLASRCPRASSG